MPTCDLQATQLVTTTATLSGETAAAAPPPKSPKAARAKKEEAARFREEAAHMLHAYGLSYDDSDLEAERKEEADERRYDAAHKS